MECISAFPKSEAVATGWFEWLCVRTEAFIEGNQLNETVVVGIQTPQLDHGTVESSVVVKCKKN